MSEQLHGDFIADGWKSGQVLFAMGDPPLQPGQRKDGKALAEARLRHFQGYVNRALKNSVKNLKNGLLTDEANRKWAVISYSCPQPQPHPTAFDAHRPANITREFANYFTGDVPYRTNSSSTNNSRSDSQPKANTSRQQAESSQRSSNYRFQPSPQYNRAGTFPNNASGGRVHGLPRSYAMGNLAPFLDTYFPLSSLPGRFRRSPTFSTSRPPPSYDSTAGTELGAAPESGPSSTSARNMSMDGQTVYPATVGLSEIKQAAAAAPSPDNAARMRQVLHELAVSHWATRAQAIAALSPVELADPTADTETSSSTGDSFDPMSHRGSSSGSSAHTSDSESPTPGAQIQVVPPSANRGLSSPTTSSISSASKSKKRVREEDEDAHDDIHSPSPQPRRKTRRVSQPTSRVDAYERRASLRSASSVLSPLDGVKPTSDDKHVKYNVRRRRSTRYNSASPSFKASSESPSEDPQSSESSYMVSTVASSQDDSLDEPCVAAGVPGLALPTDSSKEPVPVEAQAAPVGIPPYPPASHRTMTLAGMLNPLGRAQDVASQEDSPQQSSTIGGAANVQATPPSLPVPDASLRRTALAMILNPGHSASSSRKRGRDEDDSDDDSLSSRVTKRTKSSH